MADRATTTLTSLTEDSQNFTNLLEKLNLQPIGTESEQIAGNHHKIQREAGLTLNKLELRFVSTEGENQIQRCQTGNQAGVFAVSVSSSSQDDSCSLTSSCVFVEQYTKFMEEGRT